jgi:hypothetical protein
MRQLLALATSGMTIWGMWLAGNKDRRAWIVGLANQALWLALIVVFETWGLLPLTAALLVTYTRNLVKWRREEGPAWHSFREEKLKGGVRGRGRVPTRPPAPARERGRTM